MNIPQGYKQTELGIIPEDWKVVTVDDVLDMPTKTTSTTSFLSKYYVGTENMYSLKKGIAPYLGRLPYMQVREYQINDILVSNIRPYLKKIWLANRHGGCSSDVIVFRVKDTEIHFSAYIYTVLSDDSFFKYVMDSAIGTKMPRGDKAAIKAYSLTIPKDIAEQRAIAEALSDVDGLIAALDKKIAKKRLLKQGAMQQLISGKKRLPGFTDEWVDTPIGEGVRFQVGYPFQSQYFTSDRIGKRLVKNRDLKSDDQIVFYNGEYDYKFIVHNGDILIGMDGDFLPYKWDKGIALLNQRVGRLLPTKKWDLSFVMYALIEPLQKLQDGTGATTVKHLSHNDIEQMVLCIPQNYEEQQAIATILSDMDKEIADLDAQRDKYRLLKSGMMQKLLTGQIRLNRE